jgi:ribonuclease HI
MAKKKFYAVAAGRETGVFTDWATAEAQVKGHPGAKYKSFPTREQAVAWVEDPVYEKKIKSSTKISNTTSGPLPPDGSVVVYTDGGSINNPGPGGYGVVILDGDNRLELDGGMRLTTNNRMEMTAALVALQNIGPRTEQIHLYSDSSYLVDGFNKGWVTRWKKNGWKKSDGQQVLNIDLWTQLYELVAANVVLHWVKGHAGNELNERCDQLAVAAARRPPVAIDEEYEAQAGSSAIAAEVKLE